MYHDQPKKGNASGRQWWSIGTRASICQCDRHTVSVGRTNRRLWGDIIMYCHLWTDFGYFYTARARKTLHLPVISIEILFAFADFSRRTIVYHCSIGMRMTADVGVFIPVGLARRTVCLRLIVGRVSRDFQ